MHDLIKERLSKTEDKMQKSIDSLEYNFDTVRAGRANAAVLNKIEVEYYGVPTKIDQMASISVPEARLLVIQPWDVTVLHSIEKAILAANIGINPSNDGKVIRLAFPPLTEERRKELCKEVSKLTEECKVAIRGIRRDANEKIKALKKDSLITEDDMSEGEEAIQKATDKFIKIADEHAKEKEKEIMEI